MLKKVSTIKKVSYYLKVIYEQWLCLTFGCAEV